MNRIIVVVEGQSEEEFIKSVVAPYLLKYSIYITPIVVRTSKNFKGGIVSYAKFKYHVELILKQDKTALVTSMIDYFRLPNDFPHYNDLGMIENPFKKVEHLENGLSKSIGNDRFIPYIQLHEFEALLFSDRKGFQEYISTSEDNFHQMMKEIDAILEEFDLPELINTRPELAPSKRILKIFPKYNKVVFGSLIAEEIGIEKILSKCSRFGFWVQTLINRFQ
ncbi:MAG: DUF4276 family protein [Flavobacteriales bacterium]|nr:DUF4276 family protein [Flavobacteriales bacterium]